MQIAKLLMEPVQRQAPFICTPVASRPLALLLPTAGAAFSARPTGSAYAQHSRRKIKLSQGRHEL